MHDCHWHTFRTRVRYYDVKAGAKLGLYVCKSGDQKGEPPTREWERFGLNNTVRSLLAICLLEMTIKYDAFAYYNPYFRIHARLTLAYISNACVTDYI